MSEISTQDIGDLKRARGAWREADLRASMDERLVRLHVLGMRLGAIKGAAAGH